MKPDEILARWPDAERILDPLLDLPPAERRRRALAACGADGALAEIIERLLLEAETATPLAPLADDLLDDGGADEPMPAYVGPYRVVAELGRGGMSRVFRAVRDDDPNALPVAVKQLHWAAGTRSATRRFARERETLARLRHPHIARLLGGGVADDERPYLVMELVEGVPLDRFCEQHALDLDRRLRLFRQVCEAVECAHGQLVVHRDLKPDNVLVDEHGQVKLLDFGIAKWLDESAGESGLTMVSHRVLTPAHAAPEQFRGEPVTVATDVYQLGLLLYVLLAGRPAHASHATTPDTIQQFVLETDPERPSTAVLSHATAVPAARGRRWRARRTNAAAALSRRLAGDLDAIVLKALRKDPGDRYLSVEALRRDVDNFIEHRPVAARRETWAYAARKYAARHRTGVTASAAAALVLLVGALAVMAQSRVIAAERDRARQAEARAAAINTFLVRDLLAAATPVGAQGRAIGVTDVLANASRSVSYAFADEPTAEADVRTTLADSYVSLGQFADAESHARAAHDLLQRATPRDELAVLRARLLLARLALEQGRFDEARQEADAVIDAQAALAGPTHVDVLQSRSLLSRILRRQGELAGAEQAARSALTAALAQQSHDWRLVADLRSRLADVLIDLRKGEEAAPLTRAVLDERRVRLGPTHPDVLAALSQHALAVDAQQRFDEALSLAEQMVDAYEAVYGQAHPLTGRARNNLAIAHDRLGHDAEARVQVERTLAIYRETLGPDHADTLAVLRNYGILINRADGPARAEPIYREVLTRRERVLGARHANTINSAIGLAMLLARVPNHPESRRSALHVMALCEQVANGTDSDPRALDQCAEYLLETAPVDLRQPAQALRLAERAANTEGRSQDRRLQTLARAQLALGDRTTALATMREALALPDALPSWTTEELFVEMMTTAGATGELETWLLDRLERFRQRRGADDPLMSKTERHLARLYLETGRRPEAEERFRAALTRLRKTRPDDDLDVGRAMSELGGVLVDRRAFAEAEPLLVGGFESLLSDRRAGPNARGPARDRVVRLYEALGRPADAERWRQRPLTTAPR